MIYHAVFVICTYIELSIIKYHSIQHFKLKMYTVLVGYSYNLCVPHPISFNWSLYFSYKIKYFNLKFTYFIFELNTF